MTTTDENRQIAAERRLEWLLDEHWRADDRPAAVRATRRPQRAGGQQLLLAAAFVLGSVVLGGAYWYLTREERALKAEEDKPALESVTAAKPHPLAKQLEVTGIRLRTPKPGQAEVQAVVVNHSAADIASLNMDVVLMAKGTTKEVAVFPVKLKKLGPFASTEVTARTKTQMSAIDLPDWQFLEAKVVIASDAP